MKTPFTHTDNKKGSAVRPRTIYTIGHSTHSVEEFLEILQAFNIQVLVDIRSLPGSRKFPQYNKENLENTLAEHGIRYVYLKGLGGRRKARKDSKNKRWNNTSFRGYADYMETGDFEKTIKELETLAKERPTVMMCAEAVWWRCHRSMVSDYLKVKDWTVLHIMSAGKVQEHTYTSPARIVAGRLCYFDGDLFNP